MKMFFGGTFSSPTTPSSPNFTTLLNYTEWQPDDSLQGGILQMRQQKGEKEGTTDDGTDFGKGENIPGQVCFEVEAEEQILSPISNGNRNSVNFLRFGVIQITSPAFLYDFSHNLK